MHDYICLKILDHFSHKISCSVRCSKFSLVAEYSGILLLKINQFQSECSTRTIIPRVFCMVSWSLAIIRVIMPVSVARHQESCTSEELIVNVHFVASHKVLP